MAAMKPKRFTSRALSQLQREQLLFGVVVLDPWPTEPVFETEAEMRAAWSMHRADIRRAWRFEHAGTDAPCWAELRFDRGMEPEEIERVYDAAEQRRDEEHRERVNAALVKGEKEHDDGTDKATVN